MTKFGFVFQRQNKTKNKQTNKQTKKNLGSKHFAFCFKRK